jgi:4-hydroxybenzoyl-CoA reductase subunit beta
MLRLPKFEIARPRTVSEAVTLLSEAGPSAMIVAGGTDLLPNMKHELFTPDVLVSLAGIEELRGVREDANGWITIGAMTSLADVAAHPVLSRRTPALSQAAGLVAGPQLRSMGTLGGNVMLDTRCQWYNQTYFWRQALGFCLKKDGVHCHVVPQGRRCVAAHSSDTAPVLIALGAEVEIASRAGRRVVPVEEFFVADGIHNNVLQRDEIVTRIVIPARARGMRTGYQKLRPRGAIDFPMLSIAFAARMHGGLCEEARLVVSALAAKPRTVGALEALVKGRAIDDAAIEALAQTAYRQCKPVINVAYDDDYRHEMVPVFVRRAVREAMGLPATAAGAVGGPA